MGQPKGGAVILQLLALPAGHEYLAMRKRVQRPRLKHREGVTHGQAGASVAQLHVAAAAEEDYTEIFAMRAFGGSLAADAVASRRTR